MEQPVNQPVKTANRPKKEIPDQLRFVPSTEKAKKWSEDRNYQRDNDPNWGDDY